jgi:ABC-type histidine transport system ATPase subunit
VAIAWLAAAVIAGAVAFLVGSPALQASRARQRRDLNAERYLAWRGRASRGENGGPAGMSDGERRRLWIAAALAVGAAVCLVAFFVAS